MRLTWTQGYGSDNMREHTLTGSLLGGCGETANGVIRLRISSRSVARILSAQSSVSRIDGSLQHIAREDYARRLRHHSRDGTV